jgi:hypothetical protein
MSSENEKSYRIIKEIKEMDHQFKNFTKMTPHYYLWSCLSCKSANFTESAPVDCLSGGRYCAPDPGIIFRFYP